MNESFVIHYPKTPAGKKAWNKKYGFNAYWGGKFWAQRKEDAEFWHRLTRAEMDAQHVRKFPFENPVVITMYFNDRLDSINHAAIFKMIEDALKGRVIHDDSRRWVKGSEIYFHDGDCILVCISEK